MTHKGNAGRGDDHAEMRMNQVNGEQIKRRDRRIQHHQDHRPSDECTQLLQIAQRLKIAAYAALRAPWRRR